MTNPWPGSPKTHSVGDERDVGNTPTTRSRYGHGHPRTATRRRICPASLDDWFRGAGVSWGGV
jgi:hypothetical protein